MEQIKRFIECYVPVSCCNMKCEYCYVVQEGRNKNTMPHFKYTIEQMRSALKKDRLGGTCYFNLCGLGETLLPKEMPDIVHMLLDNGHYVNITNNGTMTKNIDKILAYEKDKLHRLNFSFSFHYLELMRLGLLDAFFDNINKVKQAGCSFVLQLNWCDSYEPYIEQIKQIAIEKVGAYPQIALTRKESDNKMEIFTAKGEGHYIQQARSFNSPLFEMTLQNFSKKRREFCYAGDWSCILDLETGMIKKCYATDEYFNIFENPKQKIKFEAIGKNCRSPYCVNSSHFLSLGTIPSREFPTYAALRNRKEANWYTFEMESFLSHKLKENNKLYPFYKRWYLNLKQGIPYHLRRFIKRMLHFRKK